LDFAKPERRACATLKRHRHEYASLLRLPGFVSHKVAGSAGASERPSDNDALCACQRLLDVSAPACTTWHAPIPPDIEPDLLQRLHEAANTPFVLAFVGDENCPAHWLAPLSSRLCWVTLQPCMPKGKRGSEITAAAACVRRRPGMIRRLKRFT
jgi:hypothetical protein